MHAFFFGMLGTGSGIEAFSQLNRIFALILGTSPPPNPQLNRIFALILGTSPK